AGLDVPVIHFGVGTGPFLADMRLDGAASAVGVDWRMPLDEAIRILGPDTAVQGNIDPALLQAPWSVLEAHVGDVIERGRSAKGHILNLGHGVPPETDPDQLTRIVELAHACEQSTAQATYTRPKNLGVPSVDLTHALRLDED